VKAEAEGTMDRSSNIGDGLSSLLYFVCSDPGEAAAICTPSALSASRHSITDLASGSDTDFRIFIELRFIYVSKFSALRAAHDLYKIYTIFSISDARRQARHTIPSQKKYKNNAGTYPITQ
jgi:hypothetical protein